MKKIILTSIIALSTLVSFAQTGATGAKTEKKATEKTEVKKAVVAEKKEAAKPVVKEAAVKPADKTVVPAKK